MQLNDYHDVAFNLCDLTFDVHTPLSSLNRAKLSNIDHHAQFVENVVSLHKTVGWHGMEEAVNRIQHADHNMFQGSTCSSKTHGRWDE